MSSLSPEALLLVDGYNVIGAWSDLSKTRDRYGLESARQELIEALINYTAHQGYHTKIVFDAHYQNTPAYQEEPTKHLSVYYTAFAQTADTYIEKFCASFGRKFTSNINSTRLIVATSDYAQKNTVTGYGAEWLSAQRLENEVHTATKRLRHQYRPQTTTKSRFLFNALDPQSQKRLQELRRGMR